MFKNIMYKTNKMDIPWLILIQILFGFWINNSVDIAKFILQTINDRTKKIPEIL
jgi:hypothetical protein